MSKTSVRCEGGSEGAPDVLVLENERLSARLQREGSTYVLASLMAGGEFELLGGPSPLLTVFDGKEHLPAPLEGVAVEQESGVARLRFTGPATPFGLSLSLSLAPARACLELQCDFTPTEDVSGLVYFSCLAHSGFVPAAYPWIAGDVLTDGGFAHANCMGVPILAGDPRGAQGHILALGFPLAADYRDLFFHFDAQTCRLAAGYGDGRSRPGWLPAEGKTQRGFLRRRGRGKGADPEAERRPALSLPVLYRAGGEYHLTAQLWALTGEHRNLAGEWMKVNNFTLDLKAPRTIEESLRMTLAFLERAPFEAGKGYPMRAQRYILAPGVGDGGILNLYENAALACALYRCWAMHRQEWMRERALAIIEFVLSSQRRNGIIPETYDPRTRRFGTGFHYDGAGMCLDALLRFADARRAVEHVDDKRLLKAVTAAVQEFLHRRRLRIEYERRHSLRRHDQETSFPYSDSDDTEAPNVSLLIVLERLRQMIGERRYEVVREDAEKWLLHNVLHQMSWRGGDRARPGLEIRSLLRAIEYALLRYETTQGKRYLDMAESLASFLFFALVPKELEWCGGRTRGLVVAHADWRALVPPYAGCGAPVAALQQLGKLCNDRFYAQLGDYLLRAGMVAQCDEKGVPGCGGWLPAVNSPDANAFPLNCAPFAGEVSITGVVPSVLESYLARLP